MKRVIAWLALSLGLGLPPVMAEEAAAHNPDPWEGFNRKVFVFNDAADRWVLKPVAKGYQWIAPQFVEDGVGNFFNNLGEVSNVVNNLLQGKFVDSASDGGRLLINTTVGVVGFFDVASRWGLPRHEEDLGQTLGHWGVNSGPFIMVPLLGPRTVRDGLGNFGDYYTNPVTYVEPTRSRNQISAVGVIDLRAQLLKAEELISGDRYIFMRDAYLQRREFLVRDGEVQDSFGDEDFEEF